MMTHEGETHDADSGWEGVFGQIPGVLRGRSGNEQEEARMKAWGRRRRRRERRERGSVG